MEGNTIISEVAEICKQYFAPKDRFVLAISGGVDSMVLLDIMTKLFPQSCTVVTIDHHIRSSSRKDTDLVAAFCQNRQIECFIEHINIPELSPSNTSVEEIARNERYRILESKRIACSAQAIVTAHHAQDQYETLLMNLIRGCNISGLIGMDIFSNQKILRPLLKRNKSELISFAQKNGIIWHEDETNGDCTYLRNHIRHDWYPLLAPTLIQSIQEHAQMLSMESDLVILAWEQEFFTKDRQITKQNWQKLPLYLRLIWLHDWLSKKWQIEDISSAWLGHIYHWFETAQKGSILSHKNHELCLYQDKIFRFNNDFPGQASQLAQSGTLT